MTRTVYQYQPGKPCTCRTVAGNLWLVLVGLLFFPAVFLVFIMFVANLLLASVCVALVALVKFSNDIIYNCNRVTKASDKIKP